MLYEVVWKDDPQYCAVVGPDLIGRGLAPTLSHSSWPDDLYELTILLNAAPSTKGLEHDLRVFNSEHGLYLINPFVLEVQPMHGMYQVTFLGSDYREMTRKEHLLARIRGVARD